MTYRIEGLDAAPFAALFAMSDVELAARNAQRVIADAPIGYPCRIDLADAAPGDRLILLNHVSHDVANPYRAIHAIFVREGAKTASYVDATPPVFASRTLSLRGFDAEGMMHAALIALPGEADAKIRELFDDAEIETIHAHNAARGCFSARIERN